ncbi:non-ribosomal peptide synthetase [Kitasatospora kifunensis]|uniref:Amino acid adenylation domain-containing protein n=1 Tax=Kitasatospora kifunensis TaxID=58351 RepID=A0A7W7VYP7_KITKI|nr:non-ribosomal peptide synthetase [Kitasatospora kifunensis]MBB4927268.1 amino acid adenylation domain-containing protein [Kitasatospora kifunensis]
MDSVDSLGAEHGRPADGRATSLAQQRLWFLDQLRPGQLGYLLPMALRIRGELDVPALTGALAAVIERHQVLRTCYAVADGEVVQHVVSGVEFALERHDLSELAPIEREERERELIERELRRRFDLAQAPHLRATLVRLAWREQLLIVLVHHIAFDGPSWTVLCAELSAAYGERTGGAPAELAPLAMQYADFAQWQREQLTGPRLARQLDYWREQLAGLAPLELPTDRPRQQVADGAGDVVRFEIPAATMAAVDQLARRHRATRFMVVLAAFQALLGRYTGQRDLAVGTPVAARTRKEAEGLIGVFVNTVPLRADLSGSPSFATLLERVRGTALDAFSHAELPFELLAAELTGQRDPAANSLFQTSFSLRTSAAAAATLPGLEVEQVRTTLVGTPFDLSLDTDVLPDGRLNARLQYATALFDRSTVRRLADAFRLLLDGVLADPELPLERLALLPGSEPDQEPSAESAAGLERWSARLAGLAPLELPTDRRRPAQPHWRGARVALRTSPELGTAVDELAEQTGSTPFMVLLAGCYLLLSRYSGQRDLAVCTSAPGRAHPGTGRLLGAFANTLVLRGDLSGTPSFVALLERVRATVLEAFQDAEAPFERLAARLAPAANAANTTARANTTGTANSTGTANATGTANSSGTAPALARVRFELRPPTAAPLDAEQVELGNSELVLTVQQLSDGALEYGFAYATALFDRATIERFAGHYERLLVEILLDPDRPLDQLTMLWPDEQRSLTRGWHDTTVLAPEQCLPELITEQAARTPAATAVVFGDERLSYAELDARAARLARHLRAVGVRAETPVAIMLRRDADLVTALLAVHRAGGVYVPIDPAHPARRRAHLLRDSGAMVLVSQSWIRAELAADGDLRSLVGDGQPAESGVQQLGGECEPADGGLQLVLLDEDRAAIATRATGPLPPVDPAAGAYLVYTSGSTGQPKGVLISHEAIRNRVLWTVRTHGLVPSDRVLQKTTVGFDAAMWEFLAPLVCGAAVVVAGEGVPRDPAAMVRAVAEHGVTVLQVVPSVLRSLVQERQLRYCTQLRLVFSAGEPLPAELCERLLAQVAVTLVNTYGPTECAIDVTSHRYTGGGDAEGGGIVPIGTPLDNTRILVLDPDGVLCPIGVPGELCVAGVGLARGYVGRGELTAERFVPNPYPMRPGERLYRTGDLVRRRADGTLEYLGRLDRQVKLRGVRIEPSEIEAVLCEHPQVAAAAVGVYGEAQLVAHVVSLADAPWEPEEVREYLAERLPQALVPAVLRPLSALPLTASGKVDRAALPGLEGLQTRESVGPRNQVEATTAAVFADLLSRDQVGVHDDFFELGGHSLLVTRLVFRLKAAFGVVVPVTEVFTRRTVAALAELLAAPAVPQPKDGLGAVVPVPRSGPLPLSSAQRRMWFLDQLEPGSVEYLLPVLLRLRGPLDSAALGQALDDLVARHEVLRTRYLAPDGVPVQVIDPPAALGTIPVDLTALPGDEAAERAEELLRAEAARPFALDREHPLHALLVRVAADEHLLSLTFHHIAMDGWSVELLGRDLGALYRARTVGGTLPPRPPVQYADFAAWQERWSAGEQPAAQLAYWREHLADLTPLELPTDRPRPANRDPRGELLALEVPADLAAAVTELARSRAVTPFVVLLTVFEVLLARYTGRTDISVGTPVAGRSRPEVEEVVGSFINTVILRADLGGDPRFDSLLDQVRQDVVAAYSHQDLPFDRLVDELQPQRDPSRNPLFQVMFDLQQAQSSEPRLDGLDATSVRAPWHTAKFDLTLSLGRRADGSLRGLFEYATALFDRATVERLAGHYLRLLRSAVEAPQAPLSRLVMLTEPERHQLVDVWNPPAATETATCVPELFERRAAATPDAEAVTFGAQSLSYAELDQRANRLAHHLRELGVVRESRVAVCLQRGLDVVVALLAVLKAGGCYVPIDPEHPGERLAFMLADADAALVVTADRFAGRLAGAGRALVRVDGGAELIAGRPATAVAGRVDPESLAYMIYTSGSTGQPKGVLIEHASYAHHCRVIAEAYDIRPTDRVVLLSALTFDVAMDQIAATLLAGASVLVADPLFWSPTELPDRVAEHGITIMEITPAYYREVLQHLRRKDPRLRGLRLMNVGSDIVTVDDARGWLATGLPGRFLCNYGPTEATVTCVLHPVPADPAGRGQAALPIGRPVPGTRAYVLDRDGELAPVGVPGELHLAGLRLARGYHGRPGLTAERFVPDPFGDRPGARLYRTGDLVRYLADGTIEFLGRIDQQVKLRGFRIELGEIEAVLARHAEIRAVAVAVREVLPGDRRLVAYVVPQGEQAIDTAELRAYTGERLPDYMIPSHWVPLAELPLTASKKVDRKALPAPQAEDTARPYTPPRDATEQIIAEVWAELLGVERVSVHDDVFLLGAHSLLVTRVLARLRTVFGVAIPLRRLFEATTAAGLAEVVREAIEDEIAQLSDDEVAALLSEESGR